MNRTLASVIFAVTLPIASLSFVSCKKDEPPPPLPSAPPTTEAAPTLAIEPIVPTELDAGTEAKKYTGGGVAKASNLQACCSAIAQNAANAPEPTATYMKQAAATCGLLAAQGKDSASAVGILTGILKGAGIPAACK